MPQAVRIEELNRWEGRKVLLRGWVANRRTTRNVVFVVLRDGSGFCQLVIDRRAVGEESYTKADRLGLEWVLEAEGRVVRDERQIGGYEVHVERFNVLQECEGYPIAKKEHGIEFLMDNRHLWLRHRRPWAVMRVRNALIQAIHKFFQSRGFIQADAPILTANACEGTTTLFEVDFFGEPMYLSQSGQLYGEAMAMAFGRIYTFGPTFRAEKSRTRRHLAEFWMIEPEMAFFTLEETMNLMEELVREMVLAVVERCAFELSLLERDVQKLKNVHKPFPRLAYDEVVEIIRGNRHVNGKTTLDVVAEIEKQLHAQLSSWKNQLERVEAELRSSTEKQKAILWHERSALVDYMREAEEQLKNIAGWQEQLRAFRWGEDLGGTHESALTYLFDTPIIIHSWPRQAKAFYMKEVEGKSHLVKGADLLAPEGYGEIIGGGERETDLEKLRQRLKEHNLPEDIFRWYLDLRRWGSVPHAGFGLGVERTVAWICGLKHVREAIPFPRYYGRKEP